MQQNKYKNKAVTRGGVKFDSAKEARRYGELVLLMRAGQIADLRRQVKFQLLPPQRVGGRLVERSCTYVADFVYKENGETVVEDSKGFRTKDYIIKRKLMLYIHGIEIKEV